MFGIEIGRFVNKKTENIGIKIIDDDSVHPYCAIEGVLYVSKDSLEKIQLGSNGRSGFLILQDGCLESEGGELTNEELHKLRNKIQIFKSKL